MARPAAKRATVAKADDWYGLAQRVVKEISAVQHGEREGVYRRIAAEMGVNTQVPRRLARAHRFLEEIATWEDVGNLAFELQRQPLTCVGILARWCNYAPDRAIPAARRLIAGELNYVSLTALEEADRRTGERISAASDRAWQTFATTKAIELVTSLEPDTTLVWAARGWGIRGHVVERKPPGALGELDHLPILHLAFARPARADRPILLVSVLSHQAERPRTPTLLAQTVLTLCGYAGLGYDALLLCALDQDFEVANRILEQLGSPSTVNVKLLDLG